MPTERELIDLIDREAGETIDRAISVAKQESYEAAVLGPRVAGFGHMLAMSAPEQIIERLAAEAYGRPLVPPPPPPRFESETEAMAWAWGNP